MRESNELRRIADRMGTQGCVSLRALSRFGIIETDAAGLGCEPGFGMAPEMGCQILEICTFLMYLRLRHGWRSWRGGPFEAREVLETAWGLSGSFGKFWMKVEFLRGRDWSSLESSSALPLTDRTGSVRQLLGELWGESVRALSERGPLVPSGLRNSTALGCEYLRLKGMRDIYRLLTDVGCSIPGCADSFDGEVWRNVEAISDACHRIPSVYEFPRWLVSVLSRSELRSAWSRSGDSGRRWIRESIDCWEYDGRLMDRFLG
jgi:hypothetical protein